MKRCLKGIYNRNIDLIFIGLIGKYYIRSSQDLCVVIENNFHRLCLCWQENYCLERLMDMKVSVPQTILSFLLSVIESNLSH